MPDQPIGINVNVTRTLDTEYVIHSSRPARVWYCITFQGTVNITTTTAQTANAYLEFAYPFAPSTWVTLAEVGMSTTVGLAVALSLAQSDKKILCGDVPAGCNVRIRTAFTGGASATYNRGTETVG